MLAIIGRPRCGAALWLGLLGCAGSAPPAEAPRPQASADAAAIPRAVFRTAPADDAPPQLSQYGRLVGTWTCRGRWAQEDGSLGEPGPPATWVWFYALDGHAIQDVWIPASGPSGTNVRIFDPASGTWHMVWTTAAQPFFDEFEARLSGDDLVMHGERRAREAFGAHRARITFHDIAPSSFRWRYEATAPSADGPWREIQRLRCERAHTRRPLPRGRDQGSGEYESNRRRQSRGV